MVIEWAMYFALGFLTAGVLALVLMTSLWRRAVRLTTRRVADGLPADMEAILADKDMAAARFARDSRRFEMALDDLRRREADARIDVGRQRKAIDDMRLERDAERARIEEGLAREADLAREIAERDEQLVMRAKELVASGHRIVALEKQLGAQEASLAALTRDVGDRDVEASTRKAEISALTAQLEAARERSVEQLRKVDALTAEKGRLETLAAQERDRADRLDKRIERLVADVADREEVADRRHRELERAREALSMANSRISRLGSTGDAAVPPGDNMLRSLDLLESRNRDLEARLKEAEQKNARLTAAGAVPGETTRAALRGQIAELAAEMVHLTSRLEGPGSPIDRIVAGADGSASGRPTLAERIRTLRRSDRVTAAEGSRRGG